MPLAVPKINCLHHRLLGLLNYLPISPRKRLGLPGRYRPTNFAHKAHRLLHRAVALPHPRRCLNHSPLDRRPSAQCPMLEFELPAR